MITDHTKCRFSTGIDEQLTAGQGKLDENGFWQFPCPDCEDRLNAQLCQPVPAEAFEPRYNCGHLFELCPQADCTAIRPLALPSEQ